MLITSLSGNEIYCLQQKGWSAGGIAVGNSVYSQGFLGGIAGGFRTLAGGEVVQVTQMISDGRHAALSRMMDEAAKAGASGVTGVVSRLKNISGMAEFTALGSCVHGPGEKQPFSTACSGQDLYCLTDAGYFPRQFVIGNIAYSVGLGGGIRGFLRQLSGGEVKEYSDIYNRTRHDALARLEQEARAVGANAVVDIQTRVMTFSPGVHEMLVVGTASYNPALGILDRPVTSELTGEELWNLTQMGYAPMRLLLGTSIYSLGMGGGIRSWFQSFTKGEMTQMTELIYNARHNCLEHIRKEAIEIGADGVVGTNMLVHETGGLVEVMAIGTAIKKNPAVRVQTPQLIPQAIIRDRDTYFGEFTDTVAAAH